MTTFTSALNVELVDDMGDDRTIVQTAKVSTVGSAEVYHMDDDALAKFIRFLVTNRHGSPFEHVTMTFRISAPIFVWREFLRHRILSANEESGRYKVLDPVFYIPDGARDIVQVGRTGEYRFEPGTPEHHREVQLALMTVAETAYDAYDHLLSIGTAKEVARMCLPLNIYSTAYITMNLRALTNFLSLRVKAPGAAVPSFPQEEIHIVAQAMEVLADTVAPITMDEFRKNGRVPL